MDLDIRRLRYPVAVAEEASFVRAAARLYMTQTALSRQIAEHGRIRNQQGAPSVPGVALPLTFRVSWLTKVKFCSTSAVDGGGGPPADRLRAVVVRGASAGVSVAGWTR